MKLQNDANLPIFIDLVDACRQCYVESEREMRAYGAVRLDTGGYVIVPLAGYSVPDPKGKDLGRPLYEVVIDG